LDFRPEWRCYFKLGKGYQTLLYGALRPQDLNRLGVGKAFCALLAERTDFVLEAVRKIRTSYRQHKRRKGKQARLRAFIRAHPAIVDSYGKRIWINDASLEEISDAFESAEHVKATAEDAKKAWQALVKVEEEFQEVSGEVWRGFVFPELIGFIKEARLEPAWSGRETNRAELSP
jgi:hypothetical protein